MKSRARKASLAAAFLIVLLCSFGAGPLAAGGEGADFDLRMAESRSLFEEGRFAEAAEALEEIVRSYPASSSPLLTLGVVYYRLDRYLEAANTFEKALAASPESPYIHTRLGFALSQMNLPHEAIKSFKRALSYEPNLVQAHWGQGLAYRQLEFYEEAIKSFREVLRLRPDFAYARYNLAEVCLITKRKCTANEEYSVLKELDEELAARLFELIMR